MKPFKLPFIVVGVRGHGYKIMAPTDALLYLNSNRVANEDVTLVTEANLKISMQKLVDVLIEHPDFFPCLDIAIDSFPAERKLDSFLLKASKLPEN